MSKCDQLLEPRTRFVGSRSSRRAADGGSSRPTTRRGLLRRRWPREPWYRRSRGGTDCRRNSCLRGAGKCDSRLRSLWDPSRRRSCPLSLPHRARRRSARRGSADAFGRRPRGPRTAASSRSRSTASRSGSASARMPRRLRP